jgi:hypothetical protein
MLSGWLQGRDAWHAHLDLFFFRSECVGVEFNSFKLITRRPVQRAPRPVFHELSGLYSSGEGQVCTGPFGVMEAQKILRPKKSTA